MTNACTIVKNLGRNLMVTRINDEVVTIRTSVGAGTMTVYTERDGMTIHAYINHDGDIRKSGNFNCAEAGIADEMIDYMTSQ